jgi:hypothetical protein
VLGAWAAARGAEAFPNQPLLQRDFAKAIGNFSEGLLSIGEGFKGAEENRDYRPGDPFMRLHGAGERAPMGPDVPAAPGSGTPGVTSFREERAGPGEDQDGPNHRGSAEPGSGPEPGPWSGPGGFEPGPDPFSGPASSGTSHSDPDPFAGQASGDLSAVHASAAMQTPDPFAGQASTLTSDPFAASATSAADFSPASLPPSPSDLPLPDSSQSIGSDLSIQETPDPTFSAGDGIGMPVVHSWQDFRHAEGR